MVRRPFTLLLALAVAFASAFAITLPVNASEGAADSCCCGSECACPAADCAAPPSAPRTAPTTTAAAVERRAETAKPAPRVARAAFIAFARCPEPRLLRHVGLAGTPAPAARVALYRAHCSFLI